jgi:hypothetical protein
MAYLSPDNLFTPTSENSIKRKFNFGKFIFFVVG